MVVCFSPLGDAGDARKVHPLSDLWAESGFCGNCRESGNNYNHRHRAVSHGGAFLHQADHSKREATRELFLTIVTSLGDRSVALSSLWIKK